MAPTSHPEQATPDQRTVYRTVQESPSLLGRIVGPTFTTREAAKQAAERFAEANLNATPTTWTATADDTDAITMAPTATRHELTVEPVTIHESADDLPGVRGPSD